MYLKDSDDIWGVTETGHVESSSVHPVTEKQHIGKWHNKMPQAITH